MPASDAPELRDDSVGARPVASTSGVGGALTLVIAAAVLYFARDVFVPLAIAGLFSFVLSPPMLWLRRHHLGRAPAAITVVGLAFIAILGFGSIVVGEVASLTKELPSYEPNIEAKLHNLRDAVPLDRLFQRGTELMQELRYEMTPTATLAPSGNTGTNSEVPVPVEIRPQTGIIDLLEYIVGPVLRPLATAGLVLVFAIFFLLDRENLRDRFIRLAGARDLHRATQMLNDAVERLSRYLWMECIINTIYGSLIGIGCFVIGVPNAALWGVLSLVLRFLPYIGTWFAALFPLALALAVASGWGTFFAMLGLFIFVEILATNVLEPWLFGVSAGMSPVAVLVSATFWTWLWGPIGLVLSTPLTACLVVIGRYAPPLRFLSILLGDEAPLAAEESFYQRLLVGDSAEATEQVESFLKTGSLAAFCEQVAIPALLMAQEDAERGVLTRADRTEIADTIRDTIGNVMDARESDDSTAEGAVVECLGARNELDDAAALLLERLLAERGLAARTIPARHWLTEPRLAAGAPVTDTAPAITCLSHLGTASPTRLRLLTRRLRRRPAAGKRLVLGLWSAEPALWQDQHELPVDDIATTLTEAVEQIVQVAGVLRDKVGHLPFSASTASDRRGLPQESEALPH
jgi:predicted PurR-regulated permease PerM